MSHKAVAHDEDEATATRNGDRETRGRRRAGELAKAIQQLESEVAERHRTEEALRIERNLAVSLSATSDLDVALGLILEGCCQIEGIDCGGVYLRDEAMLTVDLVCHRGLSAPFVEFVSHYAADAPQYQSMMEGKAIYRSYDGIFGGGQEASGAMREALSQEGMRAGAGLPVSCDGRIVAWFNLGSHTHDEIPASARDALDTFAAHIGGVIARVRAEAARRESEQTMRTFFNALSDAIILIEPDGKMLLTNEAAAARFGKKPEACVGVCGYDLMQPDVARKREEWNRQVVQTGRPVQFEDTRDGQWFNNQIHPVFDTQGKVARLAIVSRDVTQEKFAQRQLQESRDRLQAMIDAVPGCVAWVDSSLTYLSVNRRLADTFGLASANVTGQPVGFTDLNDRIRGQIVTLFSGTKKEVSFEIAFQTGQAIRYQLVTARKYSQDREAVLIGIDITDRKRMEEALRESEARLRALVDNLPLEFWAMDMEGRFIAQNAEYVRDHGDLIGRTMDALNMPGPVREKWKGNMRLAMAGRVVADETDVSTSENAWTSYSVVAPIRVGDQITGILGVAMDVTERRRLEKEILNISEKEQQRIGQDLHDSLCQELKSIEFLAAALEKSLAGKSLSEAADAREIGGLLKQSVKHTRELAIGFSPAELAEEGLVEALRHYAGSIASIYKIACRFRFAGNPLRCDNETATQLYRIAQEAVSNAVRHGKAKKISIRLRNEGGTTSLVAEDKGSGFVVDQAAGRGSGLRIMEYRARTIGAKLSIQSRPNKGTKVICAIENGARGKDGA